MASERKGGDPARIRAVRLLVRIEREGAFADRLLAAESGEGHDPRDGAFIRELVLGVVRWRKRLDATIGAYYTKRLASLDPVVHAVLRMGAYQLLIMQGVPDHAAVHESVQCARDLRGKGAAGLVNALLRRIIREGEAPFPEDARERASVMYSHPRFLVDRWFTAFGETETEHICRAGSEKHPVFLRLRTGEQGAVSSLFRRDGFDLRDVPDMDGYVMVDDAAGLFDSAVFREGHVIAQDPSAAMATLLLDPQPGEAVLDLCAAPGGKTTHIAGLMDNRGTVTAVDNNPARLNLVREHADRMGLTCVETVTDDAAVFGGGNPASWDRVLLDAPCTGSGVLSKRPDLKWRIDSRMLGELTALQARLLDNAARLVRPGGSLVYSTCSLEREENGAQVAAFLERSGDAFVIERNARFARYATDAGYLVLPHRMHGTGAFAAVMRKRCSTT